VIYVVALFHLFMHTGATGVHLSEEVTMEPLGTYTHACMVVRPPRTDAHTRTDDDPTGLSEEDQRAIQQRRDSCLLGVKRTTHVHAHDHTNTHPYLTAPEFFPGFVPGQAEVEALGFQNRVKRVYHPRYTGDGLDHAHREYGRMLRELNVCGPVDGSIAY
jgi:hypothetical protein